MSSESTSRGWIRPRPEDNGLRRTLETVAERWWVVVACVVLCVGAAAVYVAKASKVYRAQANLLITPAPADDPALSTLGLIRQSPDPTRDVETAAQLVTTPDVAARAIANLGLHETTNAVLGDVRADPVAQSDIVTITASARSAAGAQRLANAFADAAVSVRTDALHAQLDSLIPRLQAQAKTVPRAQQGAPGSLSAQITELQTLRQGSDPTVRVATSAQLPSAPSSPRKRLSLVAGLIAGLVLGIGGALALQLLDPRLRREEQLREEYLLPVLARIPRQRSRRHARPLLPLGLGPNAVDGYRILRTALTVSGNGAREARTVLLTGPSVAEGKTTTAINLAASLAATGQRVVLVDADHRRPTVAAALGIDAPHVLEEVLDGSVSLEDALVRAPQYGPHLDVLASSRPIAREGLLAGPEATDVLRRLRRSHDWVVIDAPPINIVADVLPLARAVDHVLFVVRVGKTRMAQLEGLGEFVARHGIEPAGFVLVGVDEHELRDYSYR